MTVDAELVVAAVQPRIVDGDLDWNVVSHAESIVQANARLVVFPELSLTGYVLDSASIDLDGPGVGDLVDVCAATDTVALVGAPVTVAGGSCIAMLRVESGGATVAYCKTYLGGDEERHFAAGFGARSIEVDGWRIGLGICRDTGTAAHIHSAAALGLDLYACGVVHQRAELAEQQRRGRSIVAECCAPVVMASFAGPTGGGYSRTAGHSTVWSSNAVVLAEADETPGGIARATLVRRD